MRIKIYGRLSLNMYKQIRLLFYYLVKEERYGYAMPSQLIELNHEWTV